MIFIVDILDFILLENKTKHNSYLVKIKLQLYRHREPKYNPFLYRH